MKYFMKNGGDKTLILIDEFGTGNRTDARKGSIAEAILGETEQKKKYFGVITNSLHKSKSISPL